jgi:TPR repeat protein
MYEDGKGVPQDYATAMGWYRKAAEQGNAVAQNNLGLTYFEGRGVPQDYVIAHMWFNLAAAGGHEYAAKSRNTVGAKMTPAQVAEAQKLAREWKPTTNAPQWPDDISGRVYR